MQKNQLLTSPNSKLRTKFPQSEKALAFLSIVILKFHINEQIHPLKHAEQNQIPTHP